MAGAQVKVIGVGQDDGSVQVLGQRALRQALDRGLGADRHENGSFDDPVCGVKQPRPGACVGALGYNFKPRRRSRHDQSPIRQGGVSIIPREERPQG